MPVAADPAVLNGIAAPKLDLPVRPCFHNQSKLLAERALYLVPRQAGNYHIQLAQTYRAGTRSMSRLFGTDGMWIF